ncbi:MAG: DMT family transporter [Hydrogenophaga sp.]|uniref:DMT family transporter n=1 Tax=Hydrogenophaga sp. TaxID=1904254 RepID=UPI001DE79825|nr:DMT family transporter [Hydrogenophaga sp.]MBX3610074.1 DMT family transporter [Hydrogenophaga sp.]
MSAAPAGRLSPSTIALLTLPPLFWAGNAVVGRLMNQTVPPSTLNFLRWGLALLILLPVAGWVLRPGSSLWPQWRRFALLGALGVGSYNALQYLALKTSTPLNVTLVASSMPVWMLLVGRIGFGAPVTPRAALGAACSLAGVAVVLSGGSLAHLLAVKLVPGDGWILLAALVWAWYSWLLVRPPQGGYAPDIKADWAAFLMAQMVMGLVWSGGLAAAEWLYLPSDTRIVWGWPLAAALLYVAIFPSLLAYRSWAAGVGRVGPAVASFFVNLTPLFAAVLSGAMLGEWPQWFHVAGFGCIVAGIVISSPRKSR